MERLKERLALAAIAACATSVGVVAPAWAGDPAPHGTGIRTDGPGPGGPASLGYTQAYADAKNAQFNTYFAGLSGAGAAMVLPPSIPTSKSLGITVYHQKTDYNCVPAIAQSVAHWDFGGYITPSVGGKQGTASTGAGTITYEMGTTTGGTHDYDGMAWLNTQYANNGSSWRYLGVNDTSSSAFQGRVTNEIGTLGHFLYVRVNLTSTHFPWHQTTFALHATGATGYEASGATTDIADPFARPSGGSCTSSWDGGTADLGCVWSSWTTSDYYLAKDGYRSSDGNPEWW